MYKDYLQNIKNECFNIGESKADVIQSNLLSELSLEYPPQTRRPAQLGFASVETQVYEFSPPELATQ